MENHDLHLTKHQEIEEIMKGVRVLCLLLDYRGTMRNTITTIDSPNASSYQVM